MTLQEALQKALQEMESLSEDELREIASDQSLDGGVFQTLEEFAKFLQEGVT